MLNKKLIPIILCGLISSCYQLKDTESRSVHIYNENLKSEFKSFEQSMVKERGSIEFISGALVNNCASYLLEEKSSTLTEGVNNQIMHGEYISCESLDLLKSKNINESKSISEYGVKLANSLDLGSFPSSLYRQARNQGKTLVDFGQNYLKVDEYSVNYETDGWIYSIEVVAVTDLNNDGLDDWILWLYDEAKEGNYHTYTTLIVLNNHHQTLLKAVPYSKWKR